MYSINPTQPASQETAEWGCFYGFGCRSYNFSLGLGFSGRSGSGSSLLPDLGTPPMTSLPPSAPIASLMLMLLGILLILSGVKKLI
jgi:hypothetical protein